MSDYLEDKEVEEKTGPVDVLPYTPDSTEEGVRKSGLAYSAGLMLGASVIVMLLIGLAIDAYFSTSPVFLLAGIILGAILGFYQFIRITSQINKR